MPSPVPNFFPDPRGGCDQSCSNQGLGTMPTHDGQNAVPHQLNRRRAAEMPNFVAREPAVGTWGTGIGGKTSGIEDGKSGTTDRGCRIGARIGDWGEVQSMRATQRLRGKRCSERRKNGEDEQRRGAPMQTKRDSAGLRARRFTRHHAPTTAPRGPPDAIPCSPCGRRSALTRGQIV